MKRKIRISILGDGGWGTTLAIILHRKGHAISLWSAFPKYAAYLDKKRRNPKFLAQVKIPKGIKITHKISEAAREAEIIVLAVPAQYLRAVLKKFKRVNYPRSALYLSVAKGIEVGSLKRVSEVIHEELGNVQLAVLSGPTIANEIIKGIPTTAVVASHKKALRTRLQRIFMSERFRIYTNSDVVGVELGGSLKNVIAIACGISDGLRFGANTKAALLSRGLAEIAKLGKVMGARARTFSGLSGLGDLVTTCISPYSRNRYVGEEIGRGKNPKRIAKGTQMVAEGVATAKSAYGLSCKFRVDMPITRQIYLVLYKNKSPLKAVNDLMGRRGKEE
ncbi:NAD(P)H-dependent glycerol-3-phosphate dehydrogenase [Candidatus Omnitrophota bacterium]